MTYEMIYKMMKAGKVADVFYEGMLDGYWLRLAVFEGWMTNDEALGWYDAIMNL